MNGISAVTLATGNDTRAIEAAAHSYSCQSGQYRPLTKYHETQNQMLFGELTVPVPLGIIGGSTSFHPMAQLTKKILNITTSNQLGEIGAALGLAQNFAALLALSGKGIQDAHMKLHKRKD
jgi:hydroxymethylglutaryl-CoA reductase